MAPTRDPDTEPEDTDQAAPETKRRRQKRLFRRILLAAALLLLLVAIFAGRPTWHLLRTAANDPAKRPATPAGFRDDASRLNPTAMAEVFTVPLDPANAESQLRTLLRRAAAEHRRVSIAGASHSMGGHTLYPDGIAISMMSFRAMHLNATTEVLHVGSGASWGEVLAYLNDHGRSVAIMQSNNNFSVGGSLSVNCHGWQTGLPPISSSVESFRLMKADGEIVSCSRSENTELFSLALGGYGLFGIILDVRLRVVPNELYHLDRITTSIESYPAAFRKYAAGNHRVAMAYGRLDIRPENFLGNAILNTWSRQSELPSPTASITTVPLGMESSLSLRRTIFRGSVGDAYGKNLRWWAETNLDPVISSHRMMRSDLFNDPAEVYENRSPDSTDILHEYFIPPDRFAEFVAEARRIIPAHSGDLLNVTIRDLQPDTDTFLRYADQPLLSLVMLFNQMKTSEGESRMEAMTRELIEAAITRGGRYYLCYRLHATPQQFRRAYPQADRFFALKRKYDPAEIFQNEFYRKYSPTVAGADTGSTAALTAAASR